MRFSVVRLYNEGIRIAKTETVATEPIVGELRVEDWPANGAAGRPLRKATFKSTAGSMPHDLLKPIFDPVLLRMTKSGFVLRGFEIGPDRIEVIQEWWVRSAP